MTMRMEEASRKAEFADALDARALRVLAHRRSPGFVKSRGWLVRRSLIAADAVSLLAAFGIVLLAKGRLEGQASALAELGYFCATLPLWLFVAKLYGLYARDEERTDHTTADDAAPVFHLVTTGTWLIFILATLTGASHIHLTHLALFWGIAIAMIIVGRTMARTLHRRHVGFLQNAIILGADEVGQLVARKLLAHPEYGINLVGFVDTESRPLGTGLEQLHHLGTPDDLPRVVKLLDVERVVIAFSGQPEGETTELIRALSDLRIQVDIVPRFHDIVGPGIDTYSVEGLPLLGLRPVQLSRTARIGKRLIDVFGASLVLLLTSPVLLAVAILIKLDSPGPIFFRQVRMGAGGVYFRIWKFRTMVVDAEDQKAGLEHLNHHALTGDPRLFKIPDDPRATKAGSFLRRHYLDELPQLINVLRGEMSLVGPRPLILSESHHFGEWALKRLKLKPGMTGLWQVLGGSAISFEEMVKLDYLYVTTWSLWNDIRLLSRTIPVVFRGARAA